MAKSQILPLLSTYRSDSAPRSTQRHDPRYIFSSINSGKYNPNVKYMFPHDQFKTQNAPILRFYASFDDRGESPRDWMKFRKCHILFYVEDGTIKVYEPHQRNTGFEQGLLVGRTTVPKPDGGFYGLGDLNLGNYVSIFGKSFKILDCEPFTKNYLREMGYRVSSPEPEVIDPVYADRQEMDMHRATRQKPHKKEYKLATFYKSHPKYLHFYVIYNSKPRYLEDIHYASMYFNVVDNTIKIVDEKKLLEYKRQITMGNYDTYLILKATMVPKKFRDYNLLGNYTSPTILNLSAASRGMRLQEIMSCRSGGANNPTGFLRDPNPAHGMIDLDDFYTAKDFDLGITINVFGSEVYIYDCDEFTKGFYRSEFNKELIPVALPEIEESRYPKLVYKENFGNPEDSLQTCNQLASVNMPKLLTTTYALSKKPCHKGSQSDYLLHFLLNCRKGYDSKIFTFLSKIVGDKYFENHYFVIRWFLEDDTIEISGLNLNYTMTDSDTGMFLKRRKLTKPTSEVINTGTCYYKVTDMFVGNTIYAIKKAFYLFDADHYTYDYMERHCDVFVNSNIKQIKSDLFPLLQDKVCKIKSACESYSLDNAQYIKYDDFKTIILDNLGEDIRNRIPEQQIKTLARNYAFGDYVGLKLDDLISRIQAQLKKEQFEDFEKLETLFQTFDLDNENVKGYFEPVRIYDILRSYPLPIDRDLIKSFVFKFPQNNGLISYEEVLKKLNYFDDPAPPSDLAPYAININWENNETVKNVQKILYNLFLKDLTIEKCPNCE